MKLLNRAPRARFSLLTQFSLVSAGLTLAIAVALAWGLQRQLEQTALQLVADSAADQVTTLLNPNLAPADLGGPLAPDHYARLDALIRQHVLGDHIARVKVWNRDGLLLYSDETALVGRHFPISHELSDALQGEVAMEVSELADAENEAERGRYARLFEVYVPLRLGAPSEIVGAYELYQDLSIVEPRLAQLRGFIWTGVGVGFLLLYGTLFTLVRRASQELIRRNEENGRLYQEARQRLAERQQAEIALRASEERFRVIFQTAGVSIWEEDFTDLLVMLDRLRADGVTDWRAYLEARPDFVHAAVRLINVRDVNEATLKLLGARDKAELLGSLDKVFVPESLSVFQDELVAIAEGQPYFAGEIVGQTLQGQRLDMLLTVTLPPADGPVRRALVTLTDITERKRAEAELSRANDQLELAVQEARRLALAADEANRLKSEFLATTSHELRTPLTSMLGSLGLVLNDQCDTPNEERELIGLAQTAAQHLLTVVNDILDLARIEAGRTDLDFGPVDLGLVLREVTHLTRPQASEKGLSLLVAGPAGGVPAAYADHSRVRQILLNLVSNSLKFSQHGQVTLRASVEAGAGQVVVAVTDTGIGIPPEAQAKLFQPFVQVDGSHTRQYGGTGLGLTISRRLAELMAGSLTLYSAGSGHGSTFTLRLPIAAGG